MASSQFLQELDDVRRCCICTRFYEIPKLLPCLHTFCLKCLEKHASDKIPGDEETCPVCGHEFDIPSGGLARLSGNFFIQNIIDAGKQRSPSCETTCDICANGNKGDGKSVVNWQCTNCGVTLCENCRKDHSNSSITKTHRVVNITGQKPERQFQDKPALCERHLGEQIRFYCEDCQTVLCALCCRQEHKTHNRYDIDRVADKLRQQLKNSIDEVLRARDRCQVEASECEKGKLKILSDVAKAEVRITETNKELTKFIESQTVTLRRRLSAAKEESIKEIETNQEEINRNLLTFESFARYCREVVDKATPQDVSRHSNSLFTRARQLQVGTLYNTLPPPRITFSPSDVVEVLTGEKLNIVGEIVEDNQTGKFAS